MIGRELAFPNPMIYLSIASSLITKRNMKLIQCLYGRFYLGSFIGETDANEASQKSVSTQKKLNESKHSEC